MSYPIIVHCHLRWDGVWQRPQQFLSRLSRNHPILFVEGPLLISEDHPPRHRLLEAPGYPNITILQMELPAARFSDARWVDGTRLGILQSVLQGPLAQQFTQPVQWFYDPMAVVAFSGNVREIATVYDCMDELAQFKFAPPEIIGRERLLLERADVVFTGGRKLFEAKSRFNPNCHFFGCGVDVDHFAKARSPETLLPADIASIPKPVLGYFGVVDERLDYPLITKLAESHPAWSVVFIGPTAKIDPAQLPQRPGLHWFGRREYESLPHYTKSFDVCLMPFALNEATEFINPTKALEYMAAAKPIVSSAVPDVAANFGRVVKIAGSHDEFIDACRKAITEPDLSALDRGLKMAYANQWDAIVSRIEKHLNDAVRARFPKQRFTPQFHNQNQNHHQPEPKPVSG